jgi:hypothetical protein
VRFVWDVLGPDSQSVLGVIGVITMVGTVAISESLLHRLDALNDEDLSSHISKSDGREVEYTSARARIELFNVYGPPLKRAGLLGYGTPDCSTFPPQVPLSQPVGPVKAVENAYILFTLRFGYLDCWHFWP